MGPVTDDDGGPENESVPYVEVPYVEAHETHTGVVVLVGDRAFKAKKSVQTDFLDFRSPEQRERACRREVELNSRLAPDSYLGVAHLSGPTGAPAEPIIVMRRYHDRDRLASMVRRGQPVGPVLAAIAETLSAFHDRARRGPQVSAAGRAAAVAGRWEDNIAALGEYAGAVLPGESFRRVRHLAAEYVAGRAVLFTRRIEHGCIVDGHADLLADDIFWVDDRPVLLDCLEFSDDLRYVDRLDDVAFLAMDLEFLGHEDLAAFFLGRYAAHSDDAGPPSLWDFYIAYRAVVRAKVDCVRLTQGRPEAATAANQHLEIADRHLRNGAIRLAIVGGGPGTGKSTLARRLAEHVGAMVFSTDDVRRELHRDGEISGEPGVLNAGLYSPDNVAAVYHSMLHRARSCLSEGRSVVLDGTWRDPQMREQARRLAAETHAAMVEIWCAVPVEVAAARIRSRRGSNSDATPEIAEALAADDPGWETAARIDTSQSPERSLAEALDAWRAAVCAPPEKMEEQRPRRM